MDADALFPNLSSLVQSKTKQTLCQYGVNGKPQNDDYWNLKSSCWAVLTDQIHLRCGPHQTLKTLDEFVRLLPPNTPTGRIKDKICSNSEGSEFLDTVVEAAWMLHFLKNGFNVELEKPLDTKKPKGSNADIFVILNEIKCWLEATNVKLSTNNFPIRTSTTPFNGLMSGSSKEHILAELAYRAKEKYKKKFGEGVRSGLFKDEAIIILLCVFKCEEIVLHNFDYGNLPAPEAPEGLFDDESRGLNLVRVHTLDPSTDDVLCPHPLADWIPAV